MLTYILIMLISTSYKIEAGAGAISQEFKSEERCIQAGKSLAKMQQIEVTTF